MSSSQEREEMHSKLAELDDKVTNAQARLDQIPFTEQSEALHDMAAGLLDRLHELNRQINAALDETLKSDTETSSEDTSEGGNEHGS